MRNPGMETAVSQRIRDALEENHMTIASCFWDTGPTYFSGAASSKIEHYIVPTESIQRILTIKTLR
eukprot:4282-Pyramimonas_sp.AAC.1